jgi:hypothetical protein
MTIEVRSVIHFFDLLDTPDGDLLARLEKASGEGIVNLTQHSVEPQNFSTEKQTLTMNRGSGDPDETKIAGNKNCN